ncbi:MAG: T9SS type A sorting domain-containing protein [Saprospiraceae bacterium]
MKRLERCLAGILIAALPMVHTFSQTAVVAAGGDATGPNGTIAYSIGQFDYEHYAGETGSINLGVQQPDVVIIIGTEDFTDQFDIQLFPNPVSDETNLYVDEISFAELHQNLSYELYDLTGKMMIREKINSVKTIVRTSMLTNGEYVLRIMSDRQDLKTFKIVKSN